MADAVFLLVQRALFGACDMATILGSHPTLLGAEGVVLLMHGSRLGAVDFARPPLLIDAGVLMRQAIVHLIATGMVPLPLRFGVGGGSQAGNGNLSR